VGRLDGKVAFVTGGARGQGLEAARAFCNEGAKSVLADILDDEGKTAAAELGDAAHYVHLDVTNEDEWKTAVAEAESTFGPVSVLLNNAGILRFAPIEQTQLAEYMTLVNVNQVGVFLGMREVIPSMRRAGGGSIINTSSVEGLRGGMGLVAYTASKFAVRGMTKVAAVELGKDNIRVNSIHPGVIDTAMVRAQGLEGVDINKVFGRIPLPRAGTAADIAALAVFLASDESSYCTGAEFVIDGGATSFIGWGGPYPRGR